MTFQYIKHLNHLLILRQVTVMSMIAHGLTVMPQMALIISVWEWLYTLIEVLWIARSVSCNQICGNTVFMALGEPPRKELK